VIEQMVKAKTKSRMRKAGIVLLFVALIVGAYTGIRFLTGSGFDPYDSQKVAVSLPLQVTVTNARTGAVVNTGSYIFIYVGGIIKETLDTGADGIVAGTLEYATGETIEMLINPSGYIPLYVNYLVPKEFITATYHATGLAFQIEPACNGETVYVTDRTMVEKNAASGSAWNCTPTVPFIMGYWYIQLDTEDEALGGSWYLPANTEQYPIQKTYAIMKFTDASGYADGMTIDGWTLSNDGVTWYVEIPQVIVYDSTYGLMGVFVIPFVMHMPQSLNAHQVCFTAQIISECDPQEMQIGNYAATGLLWDDTDGAAVYVGMEA
jgi:hypothetical protein